jgi:shikimate dehydrogenase
MHNAAFEALGIHAAYLAFDVHPDSLGAAIAGARALGVRQLAVSLPHKLAVMEHLDYVDPVARQIGAVNTVTRVRDELHGSNTDWRGATLALEHRRQCQLYGARAVVLGAGGAARAIVYGLIERGAHVTVLNRTVSRARELAESLGASASGGLDELAGLDYDVLVNASTAGLGGSESPVPAEALRSGSVVMDAVYEPAVTPLLHDARERGARPLGGKWMLIYQAAEQFRLWTGRDAPIEVMESAFDAAGSEAG